MKRGLIAAVPLLAIALAPAAAMAGRLEDAVLAELNFARTNPSEYAREVLMLDGPAYPEDDDADFAPQDPYAVREAIDFLERQEPLPPLRLDDRLAASAKAHRDVQGPRGGMGHDDAVTGGLQNRLHAHGVWAGLSGENISYGYGAPREIVKQLIVDSGVQSRGHRKNIFDTAYQYAGVGCGPHRTYRYMCVIDFAGMLVQR